MTEHLLDDHAVDTWLAGHPSWVRKDSALELTTTQHSFTSAIALVRAVADLAEAADHHPDIDIRWRTVRFELSTHSEGGLTVKDLALAEQIDDLLSQAP